MKKLLPIIFAIISIIVAIYAVFRLSPTIDFAVNFIIVSFGFLALIWALKAYRSLAPNSSLKYYSLLFLLALLLVVLYRILVTISLFFTTRISYYYIDHIIIILSYILFVAASYKIMQIGKEFGFSESTEIIKQALKDKRKKK